MKREEFSWQKKIFQRIRQLLILSKKRWKRFGVRHADRGKIVITRTFRLSYLNAWNTTSIHSSASIGFPNTAMKSPIGLLFRIPLVNGSISILLLVHPSHLRTTFLKGRHLLQQGSSNKNKKRKGKMKNRFHLVNTHPSSFFHLLYKAMW